jgi:hypothetical protein
MKIFKMIHYKYEAFMIFFKKNSILVPSGSKLVTHRMLLSKCGYDN